MFWRSCRGLLPCRRWLLFPGMKMSMNLVGERFEKVRGSSRLTLGYLSVCLANKSSFSGKWSLIFCVSCCQLYHPPSHSHSSFSILISADKKNNARQSHNPVQIFLPFERFALPLLNQLLVPRTRHALLV